MTALGEDLVDRLRILNYEKDYVAKYMLNYVRGKKAINVATFSVQTNPTEQFNTFKQ